MHGTRVIHIPLYKFLMLYETLTSLNCQTNLSVLGDDMTSEECPSVIPDSQKLKGMVRSRVSSTH